MKLGRGIAAFAMLAVVYGCATQTDDTQPDESSENALSLRHGTVDQAGIVEASTMMLAGGPADGLLDPYNQEDPFAIRGGAYQKTFADRLAMFDAQDDKADWTPEAAKAWSTRMSQGNYLVVDTSKPCGDFDAPHTYLEIERAHLQGREHATCGGRMPNEDALDVTLNFLVRGPAASASDAEAWHDGVDHATQRSNKTFPYLAELNGL